MKEANWAFDLDGKPWEKVGFIPPIILVEEKKDGYEPGWYHSNEVGMLEDGPFGTLQEAAQAFNKYCERL